MYNVSLTPQCEKDLRKIRQGGQSGLFDAILKAIVGLETDPRPPGCTSLRGRAGYRLRVREYRILYSIDDRDLTVEIIRAAPRGDVYK